MELLTSPLLLSPTAFPPQISDTMLAVIRTTYGALLIGHFAISLRSWDKFFISEKFGGYAKSSPREDALQNPFASVLIGSAWLGCAIALVCNYHPLMASLINLIICRYYFVEMRWKGVARGMGAPGFMSYWLAFIVFLLQCSLEFAPMQRSLVLLVAQVDFALIMLSAGLYKMTAGYAVKEGMEYGMVNPEWGYWWKFWKTVKPNNPIFNFLDQMAWLTEVVAAVLMVVPATRFMGGALMLLSFIFIRTQIRLGVLCEMVIASCFLFFHPGSIGEVWCQQIFNACHIPLPQTGQLTPLANQSALPALCLEIALWIYLVLLPLSHAGLFFNFYKKKRLPEPLQVFLEKYTNTFGIIIWRVFSVDVVNFFIMIYEKNQASGQKTLISNYGWPIWGRFSHVCESIAITSLFTTLKYYCSNKELFEERILRYSRTLPCAENSVIEFEYNRIAKENNAFVFKPIARYTVDTRANNGLGSVIESIEDDTYSTTAAHVASPVHEGATPGSYAPAAKK